MQRIVIEMTVTKNNQNPEEYEFFVPIQGKVGCIIEGICGIIGIDDYYTYSLTQYNEAGEEGFPQEELLERTLASLGVLNGAHLHLDFED